MLRYWVGEDIYPVGTGNSMQLWMFEGIAGREDQNCNLRKMKVREGIRGKRDKSKGHLNSSVET